MSQRLLSLKVVGIPGGICKFERNTWIPIGINAKKVENSWGVVMKLTGIQGA